MYVYRTRSSTGVELQQHPNTDLRYVLYLLNTIHHGVPEEWDIFVSSQKDLGIPFIHMLMIAFLASRIKPPLMHNLQLHHREPPVMLIPSLLFPKFRVSYAAQTS